MQPIISIVGKSDSGKTTLLEGLVAELKQRGYRAAVLKHSAEDLEFDQAGKDSWRFSQAGSEISAINSSRKLAVYRKLADDLKPQELPNFIGDDYDLILTEGFKKDHHPKIEVHRNAQGKELLSPTRQLIAVVTDEPLEVDAPQFSKEEMPKIADLIENILLTHHIENEVDLFVNNDHIPIKETTRDLLSRTLTAMVSDLKEGVEISSLRIFMRRKS